MDLLRTKVQHVAWGAGVVIAQDAGHVTVAFEGRRSEFVYPDAFASYLTAEDPAIQSAALEAFEQKKEDEQRHCAQQDAALAEASARAAERKELFEQRVLTSRRKPKSAAGVKS